MQLDFPRRELTVKLVYYGPALSGKTTNLQAIHRLAAPGACGRLMTLETKGDRTLFFDLLPMTVQAGRGVRVRFKVYTVPGQVIHRATRRLVLQGADGVAFVADSQICETRANQEAFLDMQSNLRELGVDPARVPLVIQFNKRDLPRIRPDEEIDRLAALGREPVFKAIAIRGIGVMETLLGLVERTWHHLEREHHLKERLGIDPDELVHRVRAQLGLQQANATAGSA